MHFNLPTSLSLLLLSLTSTTTALGINCQGSALCSSYGSTVMSNILYTLNQCYTQNPGVTFTNGQQIACNGNICAFLQNTSGPKTLSQVKGYVQDLINHNCKVCGSDPTEPGNNVATGQLTVNYVSSASACGA